MIGIGNFYMDVHSVGLVHECVIDKNHKCEYPRGRGCYGLVYAIDGEAQYRFVDGEWLTVRSGDVILLPPSAAYHIVAKGEFRHYTVNFDINESVSSLSDERYCRISVSNPESYHMKLKAMSSEWSYRRVGYEMLAVARLYELLSMLYGEYSYSASAGTSVRRLSAARQYIEQNFDRDITLELLAQMSDMSVTNFRREWKKTYGTTPLSYRDSVRLSYAREYLSCGYFSVGEVAEKCGFFDNAYFCRFFRKHTGMSPGAYKSGER